MNRPAIGVACLVAAFGLLQGAVRAELVHVPTGASGACPSRPLHAEPMAFHFSPGFDEHRSWIEAFIPEPDATDFVLCLDGRLVAERIGQTPHNGLVQASVRTTWTDVQWLLGALDSLAVPARWDLGYTTYTLENAGVRSQPRLNTP